MAIALVHFGREMASVPCVGKFAYPRQGSSRVVRMRRRVDSEVKKHATSLFEATTALCTLLLNGVLLILCFSIIRMLDGC